MLWVLCSLRTAAGTQQFCRDMAGACGGVVGGKAGKGWGAHARERARLDLKRGGTGLGNCHIGW